MRTAHLALVTKDLCAKKWSGRSQARYSNDSWCAKYERIKSFSVTNEPKQSSKALKAMFESIASAILEHFIISFYYNESQLEF